MILIWIKIPEVPLGVLNWEVRFRELWFQVPFPTSIAILPWPYLLFPCHLRLKSSSVTYISVWRVQEVRLGVSKTDWSSWNAERSKSLSYERSFVPTVFYSFGLPLNLQLNPWTTDKCSQRPRTNVTLTSWWSPSPIPNLILKETNSGWQAHPTIFPLPSSRSFFPPLVHSCWQTSFWTLSHRGWASTGRGSLEQHWGRSWSSGQGWRALERTTVFRIHRRVDMAALCPRTKIQEGSGALLVTWEAKEARTWTHFLCLLPFVLILM